MSQKIAGACNTHAVYEFDEAPASRLTEEFRKVGWLHTDVLCDFFSTQIAIVVLGNVVDRLVDAIRIAFPADSQVVVARQ
ncbi:hypothetical protein D3C85_1643370 [compost metagenome]